MITPIGTGMETTKETLAEVETRVVPVRRQLEALYAASKLSKALYYKGLMMIAYEYAVAQFPEEAITLVFQIEPSYFKNECLTQMRADVEFFQRCSRVYRELMAGGVIPFDFHPIPRKMAQA